MNNSYIDTVRLLLDIAPTVFKSGRFAMKGGTALNLFVQNMPRLSVDIDVVFVDHASDRVAALAVIGEELRAIQRTLEAVDRRVCRTRLEVRASDTQCPSATALKVHSLFTRDTALPCPCSMCGDLTY